jgi:hypothetical protein
VLVLFAALLVAGGAYLLLRDDGAAPVVSKPTSSAPIQLQGVGAYDPPPGDGAEHGDRAHFATDRDPGTSWASEDYRSFTKGGVGLVLHAPKPETLSKLTVASVGSGFDAQIKAGNSPMGPFTDVSGNFQPVGASRTFAVDTSGKKYGYYVVWLKLPFEGGKAEISEVTART